MAYNSTSNLSTFNYVQASIPIFDGEEYSFWSIRMKTLFISHKLWDIVVEGFQRSIPVEKTKWTIMEQIEYEQNMQNNARALYFIQQGVSNKIFPKIMNATTANEAWKILKSRYMNSDKIEDDVRIDIEAIIQHCEDGHSSFNCCIYRVPRKIRNLKEEDYTPTVVSIGPFHYGNVRLQDMERVKQLFFKRFKQRAGTNLADLINFVKDLEPRVRTSYSEDVKLNKRELMKVILVDAGFIIELFMNTNTSEPWLENTMADLLLLENQLPFFFLEELFNKAFCRNFHSSFLKLTYDFFKLFNLQNIEPNRNAEINHFTDLLRLFYLPEKIPARRPYEEIELDFLPYSANELHDAGVKFSDCGGKCLLDLTFEGHVLEIPSISVEDGTETLFRNMIALEQCHYLEASYITDYADVLDSLINSDKDVEVLIHNKIIHSGLGDTNDVAKVFNGLLKHVTRSSINSNYLEVGSKLNKFYKSPLHRLKATLRRDYGKTPWQAAASIAGIVLLILTFVQTIFSALK